jgi:hypothetical protein
MKKEFVAEGDEFQLSCMVHGYKRPVFEWYKDHNFRSGTFVPPKPMSNWMGF